MNKLVYSALAMTLVAAPGAASEEDWLSLDREIESLSNSLARQSNGPKLGGSVFVSYRNSSDIEGFYNQEDRADGMAAPPNNGNSLGGFNLDRVRLSVSGNVDDYGYKVSFELSGGTATVRDAYVQTALGDSVNMRAGNFRQPFLFSSLRSGTRLLFHEDRSAIGSNFDNREQGLMVFGNFDQLAWFVSAQDQLAASNPAGDGNGDDLLLTGRVEWNLLGEGASKYEGAYGASDETNVTLAASIANEGGHKDGNMFSVEGEVHSGPFYAGIELADFDEGSNGVGTGNTDAFAFGWNPFDNVGDAVGAREVADTTPWAATVSYMITPDEWEVMLRYEDSDNDDDETVWRIGVNRYLKGHSIKWHIGWASLDTDAAPVAMGGTGAEDADVIILGIGIVF